MGYVNTAYDYMDFEKEMVWIENEESRLAGYADMAKNPDDMVSWFNGHVN